VFKGSKQKEEAAELLFSSNENVVMLGNILFPKEILESTRSVGCWHLLSRTICAVFWLPVLLWQ